MTTEMDALPESVGIALEGAWAAIKDADTWNALREYVEGLARENARLTEQMRLLAANQNERTDNALELWQRAEARVQELELLLDNTVKCLRESDADAEHAESELAAVKRRIAEAPIQMVPCAPTPAGLVNKRMRLLDDEESKR